VYATIGIPSARVILAIEHALNLEEPRELLQAK
jgi:hypothetical protein